MGLTLHVYKHIQQYATSFGFCLNISGQSRKVEAWLPPFRYTLLDENVADEDYIISQSGCTQSRLHCALS